MDKFFENVSQCLVPTSMRTILFHKHESLDLLSVAAFAPDNRTRSRIDEMRHSNTGA